MLKHSRFLKNLKCIPIYPVLKAPVEEVSGEVDDENQEE